MLPLLQEDHSDVAQRSHWSFLLEKCPDSEWRISSALAERTVCDSERRIANAAREGARANTDSRLRSSIDSTAPDCLPQAVAAAAPGFGARPPGGCKRSS